MPHISEQHVSQATSTKAFQRPISDAVVSFENFLVLRFGVKLNLYSVSRTQRGGDVGDTAALTRSCLIPVWVFSFTFCLSWTDIN